MADSDYCIVDAARRTPFGASKLRALPDCCLQQILGALGDLDDLLNFACVASDARAFLHAHWKTVRPDGADYRRKFVDRMDPLRYIARSAFNRCLQSTKAAGGAKAEVVAGRTTTTVTLQLASRSVLHFFEPFPLQPVPAGGNVFGATRFATSMRVGGAWIDDPDGYLEFNDGSVVLRIESRWARTEVLDAEGGIDLMRFLRRMPLDLPYANLTLRNDCNADITVTITYYELAADPLDEWLVDVLSRSVRFAADAAVVVVSVPLDVMSAQYITLTAEEGLPPVERFTLIFDLIADEDELELETTTTWRNQIPGWTCRMTTGGSSIHYRLPIESLCFCRLARVRLEIQFASAPAAPAPAMHLYVCSQNFIRHAGGMLGIAFAW